MPFSIGFIGGSHKSAAGYAHYSATRIDGLWSLDAGVFSKNVEVSRASSIVYGVKEERIYSSLSDLLKNEKEHLDAIVLLTPTPMHHQMVIECLRAKMPVICEKALSMTSLEALEIKNICENTNGFLVVIYNYSGYPMVRELRKMIQGGVLGKIIHFQAEMPQEGYIRTNALGKKPQPQSWRLVDGPVPTIHLDLAVHLHELIHYLTGLKPIEVVADQVSKGWFNVIDNVICLARYTDNVQGQFWFSKCALGQRNGLRLRIYGTEASAEWYQMNPEELIISYSDGRRSIYDRASNIIDLSINGYDRFKAGHPAGFIEALANLYKDIYSVLKRYKNTGEMYSDEVFGANLAFDGICFLEAMVKSQNNRGWTKVEKI
jgi:predicted dehydrogenase